MKFVIIAVVTAVVLYFAVTLIKRSLYTSLAILLQQQNYAEFEKKADSFLARTFIPKASLLDLKLNAAVLQNSKKKTEKIFEQLFALKLTPASRDKLLMKAFNYYLGLDDEKMCKKYLKQINESRNGAMILEATRAYNVYIAKNDKDLKDLLEELEDMPEESRGVHEFLISKIYENRGERDNAGKYRKLAKQHFAAADKRVLDKAHA